MEQVKLFFKCKNKEDNNFFSEVRSKVKEYFEKNKLSPKANGQMVVKSIVLLALTFGAYLLILSNYLPAWLMLILAVFIGGGIAGIGFCISHDALHGAYSSNSKINKWLGLTMDLAGSNTYTWHLKHNLSHHTFTNIHHFDEDIRGVKLIRFSPYAKYYFFHRFQHIYGFFLYTLVYFNLVFVYNFQQFFQKNFGPYHHVKHPKKEIGKLIFWKIFFVLYSIVIPLLVLDIPFWQFLVGYLVMGITAGVILGLVFNLAHIVEETDFPLPDESNTIENAWAIHQLHTTNNFAPNNGLLTWYTGGLNYQVEHHLFPNVCSIHYPTISKIVKETAKKYDVPYHSHQSLWGALVSHYRMLKNLSKPDYCPVHSQNLAVKI